MSDASRSQPGTTLWTLDVPGPLWAPMIHHDGLLCLGSDSGAFYAIDLESQSIRWQFGTEGKIRSGALVIGNHVVFASDDGQLYCLTLRSGEEVWCFDLGSGDLDRVLPAKDPPHGYDYLHSTPVHAGGRVFVGSADGSLYAVDADKGTKVWNFPTGGIVRSSPRVVAGRVYFGSRDGCLYCVDAESGEEVWKSQTKGIIQGSPSVVDDTVVIGSRSARLLAMDAESGDEVWTHVFEDGTWVESSPVVRGGVVFSGTSDGQKLIALDHESGEVIWEFGTGGWSWATPTESEGTVYIGALSAEAYMATSKRAFYAVDAVSGKERWRMIPDQIEGFVTGGVMVPALVVGGVVYVASIDGRIHAIAE